MKPCNRAKEYDVNAIVKLARQLYSHTPGATKYKQILRPHICPFHLLIKYVPRGATILDVGCGAGLFIALLAKLDCISSALGFDQDSTAIQTANAIRPMLPHAENISFELRDAGSPWPAGSFDVVSLIDVMHHVRPDQQARLITTAAEHVTKGGILIYKDMADRPLWRAWANRLHDLISVREWIYYAKLSDVMNWAHSQCLVMECKGTVDMLWYRHEWCVFMRR